MLLTYNRQVYIFRIPLDVPLTEIPRFISLPSVSPGSSPILTGLSHHVFRIHLAAFFLDMRKILEEVDNKLYAVVHVPYGMSPWKGCSFALRQPLVPYPLETSPLHVTSVLSSK